MSEESKSEDPESQVQEQPRVDEEDAAPALNLDGLLGRDDDRGESPAGGPSTMQWLQDELGDEEVEANAVLVPKNRRGEYGSRDYLRNLAAATEPLDPKMGVPSHFVRMRDGETEIGNASKTQLIQEIFVSNLQKVESAMLRAEAYDMMAVFLVPTVRDAGKKIPSEKFNNDGRNLFVHWDSMTWENVCSWQRAINSWGVEDDRTSSKWEQSFLYRSSTIKLHE